MWMARCAQHEVSEQQGRDGVTESKLIKMQVDESEVFSKGQSVASPSDRIRELNKLYDDGEISEEEYMKKKAMLLDQL